MLKEYVVLNFHVTFFYKNIQCWNKMRTPYSCIINNNSCTGPWYASTGLSPSKWEVYIVHKMYYAYTYTYVKVNTI